MRQALSKGMLTAAAATSLLSLPGAHAFADAGAHGDAVGSPGVLSGNNVQAPIHVPLNLCGNTVDIVGLLNPVFGNECANGASVPNPPAPSPAPEEQHPPAPADEAPPVRDEPSAERAHTLPAPAALAETGGSPSTLIAAGAGAALLLGGGVLYRRGRVRR
jgi:LPXTG-motif cell wall-anchored protein